MKTYCVSVGKPEQGCINEDAAVARKNLIAVSDGAGGGGLFAERWSAYLLEHLPDTPILSANELDAWVGGIWELYYNQCEQDAIRMGGMALDKFYDEGSFATLVVVWNLSETECRWMEFGDSVAFHYNYRTKTLKHGFGTLPDFDRPPYLINCKDELITAGFRSGVFDADEDSVVFVASDALAHYVMMMYELSRKEEYLDELANAGSSRSKNENYIKAAKEMGDIDFEKEVICMLCNAAINKASFQLYVNDLTKKGLMACDDCSVAIMNFGKTCRQPEFVREV